MKKILALTFAIALTALTASASVTINIISNSGAGRYLTSSSATLSDGSLLRYGTFDETGYDLLSSGQQQSFASVDALFTEIGTATASSGDITSIGNDFNSFPGGVNTGDKLYTWVFNAATTGAATEWGIFSSSNALWNIAADPGTSTLSSSTIDNVVYGSSGGSNFNLSAVPEPSAYAFLAGLLSLGFVFVRRK